jgi:hypothetical protein
MCENYVFKTVFEKVFRKKSAKKGTKHSDGSDKMMQIHIRTRNKRVKYLNICGEEREGEAGRLVWSPEGEEGGVKEDLEAGGGEGEEGLAGGGQLHRLVQPPQLLHSLGQAAPAQVRCHQLLAREAYINNKVLRLD